MIEVVTAVYEAASAAELAVKDLEVARVPSAVIRQFVSDDAAPEGVLEVSNHGSTGGATVVAVTVEDRHASAVMEILGMQAPISMREVPLSVG
ncbi:MAG TPA: hypothetical protein VGI78_16955 [Acetobacteraceae bacterium]|jgi:hypothetical protein